MTADKICLCEVVWSVIVITRAKVFIKSTWNGQVVEQWVSDLLSGMASVARCSVWDKHHFIWGQHGPAALPAAPVKVTLIPQLPKEIIG